MASQSVGNQLSLQTVQEILTSLGNQNDGRELVSAINNSAWGIPAAIVAAHVSTTTDFAALAVGDLVVHIPAAAGNSIFYSVVTKGTLPAAAVVGDLYIVCRQMQNAVQSSVVL